jgi:hypothetical protein
VLKGTRYWGTHGKYVKKNMTSEFDMPSKNLIDMVTNGLPQELADAIAAFNYRRRFLSRMSIIEL